MPTAISMLQLHTKNGNAAARRPSDTVRQNKKKELSESALVQIALCPGRGPLVKRLLRVSGHDLRDLFKQAFPQFQQLFDTVHERSFLCDHCLI